MFEKVICVTTDISPDALLTLQRIKELKPLGTNSCLLLQCQPIIDVDETTMTYLGSQYDKSLLRQQQYLIDAGLKVEGKVVYGLTRAEVGRIAREEGCSLIVSGAAEQTLFGGLLYGNIAYEIIYNSSQPVLLVRLPDGSGPPDIGVSEQNLLDHVLFPTDFSDNAQAAFEYLEKMAGSIRKITLFHIQDKNRIDPDKLARLDEFNESDRRRLQSLVSVLQTAGAGEVDIKLSLGSPSAEVIHFVKEQNVSLTIMGSQGRGFIQEVFLGSVSNNVARHSAASVLLIPAERHELN